MKQYRILYFFVLSCALLSCQKDPSFAYPEIESFEARILVDQRVWLSAHINPMKPTQAMGFCMDTTPNPLMYINQIYARRNHTVGVYGNLVDRPHYFRPWATNAYGYVYGNTITISDFNQTYTGFHEGISHNTIDDGYHAQQVFDSVSAPMLINSRYIINAYSATTRLYLSFKSLMQGAYVANTGGKVAHVSDVIAEISMDGQTYRVNPAELIELQMVNATQWKINIPEASWETKEGLVFELKTHFQTP